MVYLGARLFEVLSAKMKAVLITLLAVALVGSAFGAGYLETVAYLHNPSTFNTNYKPQVRGCQCQ